MNTIGYLQTQLHRDSPVARGAGGRGLRLSEVLGLRRFDTEPTTVAADKVNRTTAGLLRLTASTQAEPLLPRVAAGDAAAVEACLDRYGALVWSMARKYFADQADAEDGVQEAFVSLWRNAGRFDEQIASETTFVAMISRRRLLDLVRRRVRRSADRPEGDAQMDTLAGQEATAVQVDGVPLGPVEVKEEASRAELAMQQLKPEQQKVLRLAIGDGLSQSEIADQTGMPLGTVKSHARRGMQQLRSILSADQPLGRASRNPQEAK